MRFKVIRKSLKDLGALPKSFIKRTSKIPRGNNHREGVVCTAAFSTALGPKIFLENHVLSSMMCLWDNGCVCAPVFLKSNSVTCIGPLGHGGTVADLNTAARVFPVLLLGLPNS